MARPNRSMLLLNNTSVDIVTINWITELLTLAEFFYNNTISASIFRSVHEFRALDDKIQWDPERSRYADLDGGRTHWIIFQ